MKLSTKTKRQKTAGKDQEQERFTNDQKHKDAEIHGFAIELELHWNFYKKYKNGAIRQSRGKGVGGQRGRRSDVQNSKLSSTGQWSDPKMSVCMAAPVILGAMRSDTRK